MSVPPPPLGSWPPPPPSDPTVLASQQREDAGAAGVGQQRTRAPGAMSYPPPQPAAPPTPRVRRPGSRTRIALITGAVVIAAAAAIEIPAIAGHHTFPPPHPCKS